MHAVWRLLGKGNKKIRIGVKMNGALGEERVMVKKRDNRRVLFETNIEFVPGGFP